MKNAASSWSWAVLRQLFVQSSLNNGIDSQGRHGWHRGTEGLFFAEIRQWRDKPIIHLTGLMPDPTQGL